MQTIPFVDLHAQYRSIRDEVRGAMEQVLDSAQFILGEAVERFERDFAAYLGARHAVGVASGLDALRLALEAAGIGSGDEVIVPANTYIASALAVSATGATPVLVDCREDTYQIDPELVERAITPRTKAVMPVHLYGQAADMTSLLRIADAYDLDVIEDAAQAHGATFEGRLCGTMGRAGCFSFYPGKNLGAYGDAGCVVTNDEEIADHVRRLRNYGQRVKYEHLCRGMSSRLDSLQAAVLTVKLKHLDAWNARRRAHAARYSRLLEGRGVVTPVLDSRAMHVFHLYVVCTPRRGELQRYLSTQGIQTGIHYPIPIHQQKAYSDLAYSPGAFPVTERAAQQVLSLPMFPELSPQDIDRVVDAIVSFG
jgi:dTDP-4-amino-4,6-dideoxygalactose transaminase